MNDYSTEKIRNVCLMSHGGVGKTSLAEAMLFTAGATDRLGKVTDGTTINDYDPEEAKRQISISTSLSFCQWRGNKINIIDNPGYFDFIGEVRQGVRAADACVIPVAAKSPNHAGIEKACSFAKEQGIPKLIFINKMDEPNANFDSALDELRNKFGKSLAPFVLPIISGDLLKGYVNVVDMKAYELNGGKPVETSIPDNLHGKIAQMHEMIIEAVAETDEKLLEEFLAGQEFTIEEIHHGLRAGILNGEICPVLCGSATQNIGVNELLDAIIEYLPSPVDRGNVKGEKSINDHTLVERKPDTAQPLSAIVFKTIADPFVGKLSIFRVYSGVLKANSTVYNPNREQQEKIGHVYLLEGKKQETAEQIGAGDIGAIAKLQYTSTGDTLCDETNPVVLMGIKFPEPEIFLAVEPKAKGDEEKINAGLHKLMDEDKTIRLEINNETHEQLLHGMGEQHLEVIASKLKNKFQAEVILREPKIPYRETIRKKVKAEGKHKKQSGGHGQYGHVFIEFEPAETVGLIFEEKIFGGSVPKQYIPAVEKGLHESIQHGVLAGYPVVGLKATLVDGSYHDVDSSEMAFKIAANLSYKKGLEEASPVLLEPIMHIEVVIPESYMGDIMGDLNKRRGRVLGMESTEDGLQIIIGEVPQGEVFKYSTDLRSMTQGRGNFRITFERYEEAPPNVSEKVIEEFRKNRKEEN